MLVLFPAVPCSADSVSDVLGGDKGQVGTQGSLRVSKCSGCTSSVLWRQHDTVFLFPFVCWSCFWSHAWLAEDSPALCIHLPILR